MDPFEIDRKGRGAVVACVDGLMGLQIHNGHGEIITGRIGVGELFPNPRLTAALRTTPAIAGALADALDKTRGRTVAPDTVPTEERRKGIMDAWQNVEIAREMGASYAEFGSESAATRALEIWHTELRAYIKFKTKYFQGP